MGSCIAAVLSTITGLHTKIEVEREVVYVTMLLSPNRSKSMDPSFKQEPAIFIFLFGIPHNKWWRNNFSWQPHVDIACFLSLLTLLHKILMDQPMNARTGAKSQSFRNCRLQIVSGDHSLSTQDGGDCVVDVFETNTKNSLDIRIRSGESTT